MKKLLLFIFPFSFLNPAYAAEDITLRIDSLTNISGGGALEACGTAAHASGIKPLMVTIKHDQSFYTTLTAPNNVWCVVIKRWTFNGQIEVAASTFSNKSGIKFQSVQLPPANTKLE